MRLGGAWCDAEQPTDVGVRHSFPQKLEHLDFAGSKRIAGRAFGEAAFEGLADDALAGVRGEDGGGEVARARAFGHVAGGSRFERLDDVFLRIRGSEHEHAGGRKLRADLA